MASFPKNLSWTKGDENMSQFRRFLLPQKEITEANLKIVNQFLSGEVSKARQRTSNVEIATNVLKAAGKPLHVSEIAANAKRDFDADLERDSIVSAIVKKVKAGKTFVRTAPNTFALKEHSEGKSRSAAKGKQGGPK